MREPRWFLVCSAEYGEVIPVLDFGQGPMEYGRDCVYVKARTTRRAKVLAVRKFRRACRSWRRHHEPDENPFTGMLCEVVGHRLREATER